MVVRGLGYGRAAFSHGKELTLSPIWAAQPVWKIKRNRKYANPVGNRTKYPLKSGPETSRYSHYANPVPVTLLTLYLVVNIFRPYKTSVYINILRATPLVYTQ
jgi:hypothetical protein